MTCLFLPDADALVRMAIKVRLVNPEPVAGSNARNTAAYLSVHEPQLLHDIIEQSQRSRVDFTFWFEQLAFIDITSERALRIHHMTAESRIREQRDTVHLMDQGRAYVRRHPGNREYAVADILRKVSRACTDGGLPHTDENLRAALYALVITDRTFTNPEGCNNQLIEYIAERVNQVERDLERFDTPDLSVAMLEAFYDSGIPVALHDGFL